MPSLRNFTTALRTGLASANGDATALGREAGARYGASFGSSAADAMAAASGKVATAQKKLADAQGALGVQQAKLTELQDKGTASAGRMASAQEAVAKAERNVELQTANLTRAQDAQERVQTRVNTATADGEARVGLLSKTMGLGTSAAGGMRKSFDLLGKAVTTAFAVDVAGMGVARLITGASQFDAAMVRIQTQAGASRAEIQKLTPAVLALAGQTAQAPEELATSLYHAESTGLHFGKALDVVRASAQFATIAGANLEDTTNALTSTVASGISGFHDMARAVGALNATVGSGDMKLQDLNEALGSGVLARVKLFGVNLTDVGAALATFGDNNVRGADAATMLRTAVEALAVPAKGGQKTLDALGLSAGKLARDMQQGGLNQAIQDLHDHLVKAGVSADQTGALITSAFGKKAGGGVALLLGQFDRFQSKYAEVSKAANNFGSEWQATTHTAAFALASLRDNLDAVGIKIGNAVLPMVSRFASWLSGTGLPAIEGFGSGLVAAFHSPAVQSALNGIKSTAAGLFTALERGAAAVFPVVRQLGSDLAQLGRSFIGSGGLAGLATAAGAAFGGLVAAFRGVSSVVLPALGAMVRAFTALPGPIQATVVGFAALRVAASAGAFDTIALKGLYAVDVLKKMGSGVVGLGSQMRSAFREASSSMAFVQTVEGSSAAFAKMRGAVSGLGAAAGAAAKGGLAALKTGASGLVSMFGGPWGIALAGAGLAIAGIVSAIQAHKREVEADTAAIVGWYKAMGQGGKAAADAVTNVATKQKELAGAQAKLNQLTAAQNGIMQQAARGASGYGAAINVQRQKVHDLSTELHNAWQQLSPLEQAQVKLTQAMAEFGPKSQQARDAAAKYQDVLASQKATTDAVNQAEETHLQRLQAVANQELDSVNAGLAAQQAQLQFKDAVDQLNQGMTDGSLKGNALSEAQLNLAQSAIQAAQEAGNQAAAQAKANGVTDTAQASNAAMLKSLQDNAQYLTGPARDAVDQQIKILQAATVATGQVQDATDKMGLDVVRTWDANTQEIKGATDSQIKDLQGLGFTVQHLPNGNVVVTSDTGPAKAALDSLIKSYAHYAVNINPQGMALTTQARNALYGAIGGIVKMYAAGGIESMSGALAQVVKPGTLRVIGDNPISDEAFIPINDSARSHAILGETAGRMGYNLVPVMAMAAGGLVGGVPVGGQFKMFDSLPVGMTRAAYAALLAQIQRMGVAAAAAAVSGVPASRAGNEAIVQRVASGYGWGSGAEWTALVNTIMRESGFNNVAQNPTSTAYGMGQFLDSTWGTLGLAKTSDPTLQAQGIMRYIAGRYGDPLRAWAHEVSAGWYDTGGQLGPGWTALYNGTGQREVVLNPPQIDNLNAILNSLPHHFDTGYGRLQAQATGGAREAQPLIGGNVEITMAQADPNEALNALFHRLEVAKRGGVFAMNPVYSG